MTNTSGIWATTEKNDVHIMSNSKVLLSVWKCEIVNQLVANNKKADAKLIAAAPELLEALIAVKERYLYHRREDLTEPAKKVHDMVVNAINKATDETI